MAVSPPPKATRADSGAMKATVSPLKSDRDFVPDLTQSVPRPRIASAPKMSGLSASLRETSFHHPRQHSTHLSRNSTAVGTAPAVSTPEGDGTTDPSAVPFLRRNMDPVNDTATSFRYFTIEEMEQERKRKQAAADQRIGTTARHTEDESAGLASTIPEVKQKLHLEEMPNRGQSDDQEDSLTPRGNSSSNGNGKRKVTFDVAVESPRRLNGVRTSSPPKVREGT